MHQTGRKVVGGVDTHRDSNVAAIIDTVGRILGTAAFPTTPQGYRQLVSWMRRHGTLNMIGIEGTGAYGAGLARFCQSEGIDVVEVNRPNRQTRRRRGKSDTVDAEAAARAALNGQATAVPKAADGNVECLRMLRIARNSAVKARTQAFLQIRDLVVTAPDPLRVRLEPFTSKELVKVCAGFRPTTSMTPIDAAKTAMKSLASRHQNLTTEIKMLETRLHDLVVTINPALIASQGVAAEVAATLLIAAGDNPHRMHSEGAFAKTCGASPIEASTGKIVRHRLNRGGNRQANHALWRIVMVRLAVDPRTKTYVAKRTAEGKTMKEIMRCLKRYVAREMYTLITNPPQVPNGKELRETRLKTGISLNQVAQLFQVAPMKVSRIERGLSHDITFATRYQSWLTKQPLTP